MRQFFKITLSKATSTALGTAVGILVGTGLSLFLGEELKAKIGHDIYVFFSAIEQILTIIPRLVYLLAFLITLLISIQFKRKLIKQSKQQENIRITFQFHDTKVMLIYKNPKLYDELDAQEIASQAKPKFVCNKCNYQIANQNNIWKCKCQTFLPEYISQIHNEATGKLIDYIDQPIKAWK